MAMATKEKAPVRRCATGGRVNFCDLKRGRSFFTNQRGAFERLQLAASRNLLDPIFPGSVDDEERQVPDRRTGERPLQLRARLSETAMHPLAKLSVLYPRCGRQVFGN
jgi:hypothetical protein